MDSISPQQALDSSTAPSAPSAPSAPPPPLASTKPASTARACTRCRRFKAKCVPGTDDSAACRRCTESRVECTFPALVINHSTNGPNNTQRIRSLERRQALFERAFATLGVDLEALLEGEDAEKLKVTSASSRAASPPEQFGQRVADLMDNDVTTSDPLRFGRRERESAQPRPPKRQRMDERDSPEPSQEHQELAFQIFSQRCCVSIPFIHPDSPEHNPTNVLKMSSLLYWAIVAVGAREADELASLHDFARRRAIDLSRCTLAGKVPTFPDLQGFCIVLQWLVPVRPLGHLLSLCYELDLHKYYRSLDSSPPSPALLDRLRTFCYVLVQDRLVSIATGKPHQAAQFDLARLAETIRGQASASVRDGRLCAQAELLMIMSHERDHLDEAALLSADDFIALQVQNDLIDRWGVKWRAWALSNANANGEGVFTPYASVLIQFPFAKLHVNSVVLRGLTAHSSVADISAERLVHAHIAVNNAQEHLRVAIEHFQPPVISYTR
ncbi:hypothetical protein BCR35DRAFT_94800 [Leucosporidium creatinivorum]|uniref:Zn(2)-C6 fungal-type domain-containing protein n=1 Tax=Leucosporidium creatinivorum TaxID=106004 RepID=A0A1Y2F8H4_9BASI|nr:hypothetical protein BCR35DRAFT_94800 [Leucosporidium creatinivorum]